MELRDKGWEHGKEKRGARRRGGGARERAAGKSTPVLNLQNWLMSPFGRSQKWVQLLSTGTTVYTPLSGVPLSGVSL